MARLILIPQYPTKLRYQEWWYHIFPKYFENYFDECVVIGEGYKGFTEASGGGIPKGAFSNSQAHAFELHQIREYLGMKLFEDDILLLNDLSFPGYFVQALFHRRPVRCFAICHGTSKNRYDYFARDRKIKYPVERSVAKLFNKIFVATKYHASKLGWENIVVQPFPLVESPTPPNRSFDDRCYEIISIAREGRQKRNKRLEKQVEGIFGELDRLVYPIDCFADYYWSLSYAKVVLITSREETFGYQVDDAVRCGCVPLAPNKYSYPELLPSAYLYEEEDPDDLFLKLSWALNGELLPPKELLISEKSDQFFERLSFEMQELQL